MSTTTHRRKAFTIVELLVVIAIIGILVALLMPAIGAARESARRVECINRLKQLAVATELFHGAYGALPPARLLARPEDKNQCGGSEATWLIRLLPFMEEGKVFSEWDVYRPWSEHSEAARNPAISAFLCPSRRTLDRARVERQVPVPGTTVTVRSSCGCTFTFSSNGSFNTITGMAADYAANHGDLSPGASGQPTDFYYGGNGTGTIITSRPICREGRPAGWADKISHKKIKDGMSKTFLLGERHVPSIRLQKFPQDPPAFDGDYLEGFARLAGPGVPLAFGPQDYIASPLAFGSYHPGIVNFALADCSVQSLSTDTSTRILEQYSHRSNGSQATTAVRAW